MVRKMKIEKEIVPILVLTLSATFLSLLSLNLPLWQIRTSNSAEIYWNASITTYYYVSQTVEANLQMENESINVFTPLSNLTAVEQDGIALSNFLNGSFGLTVSGILVSLVSIFLIVMEIMKEKTYGFVGLVTFLAGILLFISSLYVATTLPQYTVKLKSVIPLPIPSKGLPLKPEDTGSFWGSLIVPFSSSFPTWIHGQSFWVWGPASGWKLAFISSLLMFASGVLQKYLPKSRAPEMKTLALKHKGYLFLLSGSILVFLNALITMLFDSPLILYSSSVHPQDLIADNAPPWWRICLGWPNISTGIISIFLMSVTVINLILVIFLYFRPMKRKIYVPVLIVLSFLTLAVGGGFIIGFVLSIIGGSMLYEWPKTPSQTFAAKLVGALKLDSKTYNQLANEQNSMKYSALTILLVNILSGTGTALYSYNVKEILASTSTKTVIDILMFGNIMIGHQVFSTIIIFAGLGVFKWVILSIIIYAICTKIFGMEVRNVGNSVAFAYIPVALQFFMPFLFTSKPFLITSWPLILYFVTNLWMIAALVVAIKQNMHLQVYTSVGVVFLAGSIYWALRYIFVQEFPIPYDIQFIINPPELILFFLSCATLISALLAISRR
jgi:hypothetical protein